MFGTFGRLWGKLEGKLGERPGKALKSIKKHYFSLGKHSISLGKAQFVINFRREGIQFHQDLITDINFDEGKSPE